MEKREQFASGEQGGAAQAGVWPDQARTHHGTHHGVLTLESAARVWMPPLPLNGFVTQGKSPTFLSLHLLIWEVGRPVGSCDD